MDSCPLDAVSVPGWRIRYVESVGSTNALARDLATPGLVVVADHQTAGRGRLDRTWETPAGVALTCSAVVEPRRPDEHWPWLPLLAGVAAAAAVRTTTGVPATLKWPNDVLVGAAKLAGILVERVPGPFAVVGVGINVHQTSLPVPTATSLAREGVDVDRGTLLEALLGEYDARLADWRAPGGDARLRSAYRSLCATLGQAVRVQLTAQELTGTASGIDPQGRLEVTDAAGGVHVVGAGDVVHVRSANP